MGRAMLWLVAGSASILVLASSLSGRPGLGLDNCIFWALIAIAAYRAFLLKMDLGAPWEGWRAAIRCISAGIVGLLAGLTVLVLAAGALVGAWNFSDRWTASSLALVIAACVTLSALQVDAQRRRLELRMWTAVLAAAALGTFSAIRGSGWLLCVITGAMAAGIIVTSWRLTRGMAAGLLRAEER